MKISNVMIRFDRTLNRIWIQFIAWNEYNVYTKPLWGRYRDSKFFNLIQ